MLDLHSCLRPILPCLQPLDPRKSEPHTDADDMMEAFLSGKFRSTPELPSALLVGKRVLIQGTSRADLNGNIATAVSFDEQKGRYAVLLSVSGQQKTFALKAENLVEASAGDAVAGTSTANNPAAATAGSSVTSRGAAVSAAAEPPDMLEGQRKAMEAMHRAKQENPRAAQQEREETLKAMAPEQAQQELRNESLLADAAKLGNQGNLAARDGKMVMLSDEAMGGAGEGYTWGQSESEVSVRVCGPAGMASKDVEFTVTSTRLRLVVCGRTILNGELHAKVIADESTFSLEDAESPPERATPAPSPDAGAPAPSADGAPAAAPVATEKSRLVTVILTKLKRTMANQHWPSVVKGGPEIDVSAFGAPIRTFNPDDADGLSHFFDQK